MKIQRTITVWPLPYNNQQPLKSRRSFPRTPALIFMHKNLSPTKMKKLTAQKVVSFFILRQTDMHRASLNSAASDLYMDGSGGLTAHRTVSFPASREDDGLADGGASQRGADDHRSDCQRQRLQASAANPSRYLHERHSKVISAARFPAIRQSAIHRQIMFS